MKSYLFEFGLL